jgi:putative hydrolase of the HAD superfamily
MIRAVIFDLYETLVTESHYTPTRASSLGPALGLDRDGFRKEWKARRPLVVLGRLSFADALTEISQALAGRVDAAAVRRAVEQRLREKAGAFSQSDPNVAAMIRALRDRNIALGVISNGFAEDVHRWPTWPITSEFATCVFSCEAGVAKPDTQIYLQALRELGVEPDSAVYIGDGGDNELAGAEQAGLRAYRAAWFAKPAAAEASALQNTTDVLKLIQS